MRDVSIEGLELIGAGANGRVYRLNEEQIVKVYNSLTNPYEKIEREKSAARTAFVHGIPTAISFDIVRVGAEYGMVYELINAKTLGTVMEENPAQIQDYAIRMTDLLKKLHRTDFADGELPDARSNLHIWAGIAEKSGYYAPEVIDRLHRFIDDIPARNTFIHGDFHPGNIMVSSGELLLIDMGDASVGHPIIDLLGAYQIMKVAAERPGGSMQNMGLSAGHSETVWKIFMSRYFETDDPGQLEQLVRFYCLIRLFAGITFSDLISDEERRGIAAEMSATFMKQADRVVLPF